MKTVWRLEVPQVGLVVLMFLLAAVTWPTAPERIPVQWNLQGEVSRYAGRWEGLLLLPTLALFIYLFLLILPRIDPARANYARFAGAYTVIRFTLLSLVALAYGVIHVWIRGTTIDVGAVILLLVGITLVVFGAVSSQLRPNWFIGIRTPWTLTSQESWTQTHRLGGWVFMILGLGLVGLTMLRTRAALAAWAGIGALGVAVLVVYSYLVWRDDPHKAPPAGGARGV